MMMNGKNKNEEKERRRSLYENNKEEYKKERKKFVRGVSKTFRDIRQSKKEEMELFEEQTKWSNEPEQKGEWEWID